MYLILRRYLNIIYKFTPILYLLLLFLIFSLELVAQPIISVSKDQDSTPGCPVEIGTNLTIDYTVEVENSGNMSAIDLQLLDTLPNLNGQQRNNRHPRELLN